MNQFMNTFLIYLSIHLRASLQASRYEYVLGNYFLYFASETYIDGTQKNWLNDTSLERPNTF